MNKLFLLLLFVVPVFSMEHAFERQVQAQADRDLMCRIGQVEFQNTNDSIYIVHNNNDIQIQRHQMDTLLRNLCDKGLLKAFLKENYIAISSNDHNELQFTAKVRGLGGLAICAMIGYWGTKWIGYTLILTGATTANTVAPGAGAVATAMVVGPGGIAGAIATIEALAIKAAIIGAGLPF
jgi:hypothetical protein